VIKEHHTKFLLLIFIVFTIINTLLSFSFVNRINNLVSIYDSVQVNYTNLRLTTFTGNLFIHNYAFVFTCISLVILFAIALFLEKVDHKSYFITRTAISIGILITLIFNLQYMNNIGEALNSHSAISSSFLAFIINVNTQSQTTSTFMDINLLALLIYAFIFIVYIYNERKQKNLEG
jgi:hypothetical protein